MNSHDSSFPRTDCHLISNNTEEKQTSKSKAVPLHAMEALGGRGGTGPTHS
jgi:hypothetical protein